MNVFIRCENRPRKKWTGIYLLLCVRLKRSGRASPSFLLVLVLLCLCVVWCGGDETKMR